MKIKHSMTRALAVAALLVTAHARSAPQEATSQHEAEALARSVTIYRDAYGVPHIYGPTDESVVFGAAYYFLGVA